MLFKRIVASVVAASALLTSGAIQASAQDLRSLIQSPNVETCSEEFMITIPGGANTASFLPEKAPVGPKLTEIATGVFRATDGRIQPVWITYRSTPFTLLSYDDSSREGYGRAASTMRRLERMCPHATFSITGYSEGADIGARLVNDIGHGRGPVPAQKVNSAVFVSNPHLADNGGAFAGGATRFDQRALERLEGGYGELGPRVLDVCRKDDPICALPVEWRTHVSPFLRVAMFRGQIPATEVAAIIAERSPSTLPLLYSLGNHGRYGGPMLKEASRWIISRRG